MGGQPFIAPSTALDRRRLGKYEVLCRLSSGGMSEIFLAHQTGLAGFKKLVVLKTILPDIGGEEDFVRMFLDEARTTAAFNHPNIAQVYELDVDGGVLFMAMEFIQGCTLVEMARACRQAKEPIPMGLTLAAVRDTALALHYAHAFTDPRGRKQIVIHRDVAEKNIMVTYDGVTKLLDFGIAKALGRAAGGRTNIGMVKGTSGYMSPEQIRGEPLDPRSDLFSLGVVMHECLTGMRLFFGKNPEEGMLAALRESVQPPSAQNRAVPPELDAVVMKALSRDREDRYSTALEMARDIEKASIGLIWHPEQVAQVVTRFFKERREETRRLLESTSFGAESTGEITIGSLLAKVKASTPSSDQLPRALIVKEPPASSPPKSSRPRAAAGAEVDPEPTTNPANQGARVRPPGPLPTPPIPAPPAVLQRPPVPLQKSALLPDYDDDSDAKTIPAAALPDEIRALRKRLQAEAQGRQVSTEPSGSAQTPAAGAGSGSKPSASHAVAPALTMPHGSGPPKGDFTPVTNPVVGRRASGTEPHEVLQRTSSGETLSITGRATPDWRTGDGEDEASVPGVKTLVARPFNQGSIGAIRPSEDDLRPTLEREQSFSGAKAPQQLTTESDASLERAAVRRPVGLIIALLIAVLLISAVGVLYLLDVLPGFSATQLAPAPPEPPK